MKRMSSQTLGDFDCPDIYILLGMAFASPSNNCWNPSKTFYHHDTLRLKSLVRFPVFKLFVSIRLKMILLKQVVFILWASMTFLLFSRLIYTPSHIAFSIQPIKSCSLIQFTSTWYPILVMWNTSRWLYGEPFQNFSKLPSISKFPVWLQEHTSKLLYYSFRVCFSFHFQGHGFIVGTFPSRCKVNSATSIISIFRLSSLWPFNCKYLFYTLGWYLTDHFDILGSCAGASGFVWSFLFYIFSFDWWSVRWTSEQ